MKSSTLLSPTMSTEPASQPPTGRRLLLALVTAFLLIGLVARVAPLLDTDRMLWQFPSEDGYLTQTISRNMALGHGMSIAGGLIPTNGTQPLMTFAYVLGYLGGGDRDRGVLVAQLLQIFASLAATALIFALGRTAAAGHPRRDAIAALAATAWFASYHVTRHSMNCLETGTYMLTVAAAALLYLRWSDPPDADWRPTRVLAMGVLLGVTFLARNDAVFLIAAICLLRATSGLRYGSMKTRRRLLESVAFGAISVVVASPWLIYNHTRFGSIMPISGQAESLTAKFAQNLHLIPVQLVEYATVLGALPGPFEHSPVAIAVSTLALLAIALPLLIWGYRRCGPPARRLIALAALFGFGLCAFYGLAFGADHFMSRYIAPLSPFFALGVAALAVEAWRLGSPRLRPVLVAVGLLAVGVTAFLQVRMHRDGPNHLHRQIIAWVDRHVPESTWVAAIQTGTLGFFHDRTINLDGKVNPEALAARKAPGRSRVPEYVAEWRSPEGQPIEFLVDWELSGFIKHPPIARDFDMIVHQTRPGPPLTVLARKAARPAAASTDSPGATVLSGSLLPR